MPSLIVRRMSGPKGARGRRFEGASVIHLEPSTLDSASVAELRLLQMVTAEYNRIVASGEFAFGPVPPRQYGVDVAAQEPINVIVRAIVRAVLTEIRFQLVSASIVVDESTAIDESMITKVNLAVLERVVLMCNTEIERRWQAGAK